MTGKLPVTIVYPGPSPHATDFFEAVHANPAFDLEVLYCSEKFIERGGWPCPEGSFRHEHLPSRRILRRYEFAVWNPGLLARVRRGIMAGRIHLVGGGYTMPSVALAMIALNLSGARWYYLSETPGMSRSGWKSLARKGMMNLCIGRRTGILCHSRTAMRVYQELGFSPERTHDLPYYMNTKEFQAIPRPADSAARTGPLRILFCGVLQRRKGLDWALEAFAGVEPPQGDYILTVAGEGPDREKLEAQAERLAAGMVRFLGRVDWDDRVKLFADHDLLLMPSRHDGWGMVAMEAMASGMAVIGTRQTGSVLDWVREDESGYIVEAEDVAELRNALVRCLSDREKTLRMGRAAREHITDWTPEIGAERLRVILESEGSARGSIA